jgi:anti-sigma-K factor RskA
MDRETLLDLIPAYALGSLDAEEQQLVEALLAEDSEAQQLLAEYQAITDLLVLAVPVQPAPSHLQADLRQRLAQRREPETPAAPVVAVPRPVLPAVTSPLRRWLALAAILTVIFGVVALLNSLQTPDLSGEALFSQLAAREDVIRVALVPGEDMTQLAGELVAVPDGTEAVIAVSNLPVLSEDETYQLWLAAPDGVISGGLFAAESDGATYIVLPITRPVSSYNGFGVSREAAGGSPFPDRPAGTGVFRVPLSS